jgi:multidrug resistance efflux pump
MDDEAKQLLRDIRDIALRNEVRLEKEFAFRKWVMIALLVLIIASFGVLGYLFHVIEETPDTDDTTRAAAGRR